MISDNCVLGARSFDRWGWKDWLMWKRSWAYAQKNETKAFLVPLPPPFHSLHPQTPCLSWFSRRVKGPSLPQSLSVIPIDSELPSEEVEPVITQRNDKRWFPRRRWWSVSALSHPFSAIPQGKGSIHSVVSLPVCIRSFASYPFLGEKKESILGRGLKGRRKIKKK